ILWECQVEAGSSWGSVVDCGLWIVDAVDAAEEAGALAGVAHVAVAKATDSQQDRVIVTIREHSDDFQAIARCLSLGPERIARAAEERGEAGLPGAAEGV